MEKLFLSLLNMSLTASYVIIFVMLVRLPLKKAPKVLSYALWSVVAFRLVCPFSFESILSLIPTNTAPIPQNIAYQQNPQINSGIEAIDLYVSQSLPAPSLGAGVNPLHIYTRTGAYIWLLGVAVMLAYSIGSVSLLKKRLKSAVHKTQNIYEADNLKTPFVLGLFRPKIYIPSGLTPVEKSCILRHEQTHIRRLDYIIKPAAFLILSIHWFNPLVWLAFILMSMDMELSCDEKVVKEMGIEMKKAYSSSLLSLASENRIINGSPLAFGEGNVRGRIKNVLHYKKPSFWLIFVAVIAITGIGIGLSANPRTSAASPSGNNTYEDDSYKSREQPVPLSNFTTAENTVTLSTGETVTVRLVMTEGTYYDEAYQGPGGGTYPENYLGRYEVHILNSKGQLVSALPFENEGQPANFSGKFDLLFDDYNNDKNPDFSIGQWGSGNMNFFEIYTVLPDGKAKKISGSFVHGSHDFSVLFDKDTDSGFYTQFYNNAVGESVTVHFLWDENSGSFTMEAAK